MRTPTKFPLDCPILLPAAASTAGFAVASTAGFCVLLYLCHLDAAFISESYVWIRYLSSDFGSRMLAEFSGPSLGSETFAYYRPVANGILGLLTQVFGPQPEGYRVVALAIHSANSYLVARIAQSLLPHSGRAGLIAGTLFLGYPMFPNGVWFVAAHATLFATFFSLLSLHLFVRSQRSPHPVLFWGSQLSLLLALMTYEATFVLPGLLLMIDLGSSRKTALRFHTFAFTSLALILLLRHQLLGNPIPGDEKLHNHLSRTLAHLPEAFSRLMIPSTTISWHPKAALSFSVLLILVMALKPLRSPLPARVVLLGISWAGLTLMVSPSHFFPPAVGRYTMLPWIGCCLSISAILSTISSRPWLLVGTLCLWMVPSSVALKDHLRHYVEAAQQVATIRAQISQSTHAQQPTLITGIPRFYEHQSLRVAPMLHWGLSDSMMPPFFAQSPVLYPIFSEGDQGFAPLAESAQKQGWRALHWDPLRKELTKWNPSPHQGHPPLSAMLLQTKTDEGLANTLLFESIPGARYRIRLLSRTSSLIRSHPEQTGWSREYALSTLDSSPDRTRLKRVFGLGSYVLAHPIPPRILSDFTRFFDDDIYGWIEALDTKANVLAHSSLVRISPHRGEEY